MNKNKGFTLIELLVVIAIIGILASVVLSSLNSARASARDSQRIQNLRNLQIAVELYRTTHGSYPVNIPGNVWNGSTVCSASWYTQRSNDWIPGAISSGALSVLPSDSEANGCNTFIYRGNGTDYKIMAHNIASRVIQQGESFARCPAGCSGTFCSQRTFAVYSDGARCW